MESGDFAGAGRWDRGPLGGPLTAIAELAGAAQPAGLATYRFDGPDIHHGGVAGGSQPGARRVLVLAADAAFRADVLIALNDAGYDTSAMREGFQASQLLHWYRPELVVVDLPLPGPQGWEPLEQIRAQGAAVVAVVDDVAQEAQARAAGAAAFLAKPIAFDELLVVVAQLLSAPLV